MYLWLGEWDQDTSDIVCDLDCYPVFLECTLPSVVSNPPSDWFMYSDNPDDNMVYTREEFAAILLSGKATDYFTIGCLIKMLPDCTAIADPEIVFMLHSFKHYLLSDGSGDWAGTTWYMKGLLNATRQMNSSNTNVGGFPAMNLFDWLNNTLYPQLPVFWRCLIKQVQILSSAGGTSASIVSTDAYLYVPSYAEMGFGTTETPYKDEVASGADETRFAMYTGNEQRIKKTYNGNGSAQNYWTRSPHSGSSTSFMLIYTGGGINIYNASTSYGVCVGLSI